MYWDSCFCDTVKRPVGHWDSPDCNISILPVFHDECGIQRRESEANTFLLWYVLLLALWSTSVFISFHCKMILSKSTNDIVYNAYCCSATLVQRYTNVGQCVCTQLLCCTLSCFSTLIHYTWHKFVPSTFLPPLRERFFHVTFLLKTFFFLMDVLSFLFVDIFLWTYLSCTSIPVHRAVNTATAVHLCQIARIIM